MFTFLHLIFYFFAVVALASAVTVISVRNPVRSVLALVVTFFAMAGLWMLLRAEFLSLVLVLVYVGAVMTLFLFVVMMLNIDKEDKKSGFVRYLPLGVLLIILILALVITILSPAYFGTTQMPPPPTEAVDYSNITALGTLLFTQYVYPFEIAGVLLLVAMIAAITLAHRVPSLRKRQDIQKQIAVRPSDRLRLVDMPAEKAQPKGES